MLYSDSYSREEGLVIKEVFHESVQNLNRNMERHKFNLNIVQKNSSSI